MKNYILVLLITFGVTAHAQRVLIVDNEKLAPIVTGEYKANLVTPNAEPAESRVSYSYFGFTEEAYKKKVNELIYDYVHEVAIDTAYIHPITEGLSLQFFKDAINNFFESYNYVRFKLNVDDLPPYLLYMDIRIDTSSLKNYVVLTEESDLYTGGAHFIKYNDYKVVEKASAEIITWNKLLKDSTSFMEVAEKYFRKEEKLKKGMDYSSYFFESGKFEPSRNFIFTKKGMTMIYQPYEAREWARGYIIVKIPKNKIKKYLHFNW